MALMMGYLAPIPLYPIVLWHTLSTAYEVGDGIRSGAVNVKTALKPEFSRGAFPFKLFATNFTTNKYPPYTFNNCSDGRLGGSIGLVPR